MTQESEMAAKWKMFEDYKALGGKLSVLERQANTLGIALHDLAQMLSGDPTAVKVVRDKVIAVAMPAIVGAVGSLRSREVDLSELDPDLMFRLFSDIEATVKQKSALAAKLKELGMAVP